MPGTAKATIAALLLLCCGAGGVSAEASSGSLKGHVTNDKEERARSYFGDDALTDQNGVSHRFFSDLLRNRVVLINVIFTHCKDACPMQTQRLKKVRQQLGGHFGAGIAFLTLSVDPSRDDVAAMKSFAEKQGADVPDWFFLTAEPGVVAGVLSRMGLWTGEPENHNTLLLVGNASRAHWLKLRPDSPPERIVADLLRLAGGN